MRQDALLKIKKELNNRGITDKTFRSTVSDVTSMVANSTWDPMRMAMQRGEQVHAVSLKNFNGILSHPTQTGKVFSKEISDRVRVIACLSRLPNILTSESTEETIESYIWKKIRNAVKATSRDSIILVWASEKDITTAVQEIKIRAREATHGVPSETRQGLVDGTNGFERILPGADRMYPDTDLPPLEIGQDRVKKIAANVPEQVWEREKKYQHWNIPEHLRKIIARSMQASYFEELVDKYDISPMLIARYLFEYTKYWQRAGLEYEKIKESDRHEFFATVVKKPVLAEKGKDLFEQYLQEELSLKSILTSVTSRNKSVKNPERKIQDVIKDFRGIVKPENEHRWFMGKLMAEFRGVIRGEEIGKILSKLL